MKIKDLPKSDRPSLPRRVAKRLLRGEKLDPFDKLGAGKYGPERLVKFGKDALKTALKELNQTAFVR